MITINLLFAAAQAVGALALLFILPGLALGPILLPGATTSLERLGRAAVVSLLTTAVGCTVLAALGILNSGTVVVMAMALTLPALRHRSRRVPPRRFDLLLGLAATGLLLLLVIVPSQFEVGGSLRPWTSTVWYYGALSDRVAAAGSIPRFMTEWGTDRPFQTDYLPFTAHAAAAFQLLPGDLPLRMELYRLTLLWSAAITATLLWRRWLSTWLAVLGAVLLLAADRLAFKFVAFKPETFALVIALGCVWAFDVALAGRSRRYLALALAGAGATYLSHAEVFLVLAALLAAVGVSRVLVTRPAWRAPEEGPRARTLPGVGRRAVRAGGLWLIVVGGGLVAGSLANFAVAGEFRLLGYVPGHPAATGKVNVPLSEAPPGWTLSGDPTWDFYVAAVAPGQMDRAAPTSFLDRQMLPRAILAVWPGLDGRSGSMLVVLLGLVLVPFIAWRWLDTRRRRLWIMAITFSLVLAAGSLLLFALSDTYVPARVGPRRLMPYELLLPVTAAVLVLWGVNQALRDGWRAVLPPRRSFGRSRAMAAAGIALAVLTAGMIAPAPARPGETDDEAARISAVGMEAWRWIATETPAGARVLTNAYTDGVVAGLAERTGIIDGRAVYLEDPAFLAASTSLLLRARTSFLDPGGRVAHDFLASERVDYLLVADAAAGASGSDIGGYLPFETDVVAVDRQYTLVRTFGDGRLRLYAVP